MKQHNGQLSAQRLRISVFIAVLIALLMGSFWILKLVRQSDAGDGFTRDKGKPDYYIEQFKYVKMNTEGLPRYEITGDKMVHLPDIEAYDVTKPIFTSLDKGKAPMTLRSERASITDNETQIHLYDAVHAQRAPFKNAQRMQLSTEYLLILPDEDVMKTDLAVDFTIGTSTMSGVGMIADNKTQELRLLHNVRGTYREERTR
jgi:lipopolysaccharide export system protein LptC